MEQRILLTTKPILIAHIGIIGTGNVYFLGKVPHPPKRKKMEANTFP